MRSLFATLRQLVIPGGARPGTPRVVIGPDVPPELFTFIDNAYGGGNFTLTFFAQLAYDTTGGYLFAANTVTSGSGPTGAFVRTVYGYLEADGVTGIIFYSVAYSTTANLGTVNIGSPFAPLPNAFNILAPVSLQNDLAVSGGTAFTYDSESIVDSTAWTPTWAAAGGGFSLGDGVSTGEYRIQGDLAFVLARLTVGATTNMGAGALQITNLPVTPNPSSQPMPGVAFDTSSAANQRPMVGRTSAGTINAFLGPTGQVTGTSPFTAAAGDVYEASGTFKI